MPPILHVVPWAHASLPAPQTSLKPGVVVSAALRRVLLMLQHLGPFKKQAGTAARTRKKVFSILVVISLVGTFKGKSLKLLPPYVIF